MSQFSLGGIFIRGGDWGIKRDARNACAQRGSRAKHTAGRRPCEPRRGAAGETKSAGPVIWGFRPVNKYASGVQATGAGEFCYGSPSQFIQTSAGESISLSFAAFRSHVSSLACGSFAPSSKPATVGADHVT